MNQRGGLRPFRGQAASRTLPPVVLAVGPIFNSFPVQLNHRSVTTFLAVVTVVIAADIKTAIDEEDGDMVKLLQMVDQLMTLCRSTQRVYARGRETEVATMD